jgi:MerR family transcriptional regulator, light-induced transcriptional regulator
MDRFRQKEVLRFAPGEFGIAQFAMQVVAIIVGDKPVADNIVRDDVLSLLVRGARTGDPLTFEKLLSEMRRLHVSAESMVSDYIPAAVAEIGEEWHEDRIDILEATVATSRMQNLLRELGRAWSADGANPEMSGSVLMVVPETEQHTLGAMIATTQMRRLGVSVGVQLLASRTRLEETLRERNYDAIFLSVGNLDSIELCRKLVAVGRDMLGDRARIAVGGAAPVGADELRRMTGADIATRDVAAALRRFELVKPTAAAV